MLMLVAAACSGPVIKVATPRHHAAATTLPAAGSSSGINVKALADAGAQSGFDRNDLIGPVQTSSLSLAKPFRHVTDLHVAPLHSPTGEAAVEVLETDHGTQRWGRLMIPAERRIIASFARNQALGQWLVIVDDVLIQGGPDPVPLTGYRWARKDVEAYAACGIPARAIDGCTSAFYVEASMWMMPVGNKTIGG
jgi:hypothetical protein